MKLTQKQLRNLIKETLLNELMPDPSRIDKSMARSISRDDVDLAAQDVGPEVLAVLKPLAYSMVADQLNSQGVGGAAVGRYTSNDVSDLVDESGLVDVVEDEFIQQMAIVFGDFVQSLSDAAVDGLYKR